MQRLEVSCAVRPIYGSLSAKGLELEFLATGKPRKHLGLRLLDPLCAACVYFPPSSSEGSIPTEPAAPHRGAPNRSECATISWWMAPNHSERAARSLAGGPRTARAERSPLLAREESVGREMAGYFGLVGHDFHRNRKGSFTCRKYTTRDPQLYFPSEGRHAQDFLRPEKIRLLRPDLNPRSWVPEVSMLPVSQ
jgi:hypothetical protein